MARAIAEQAGRNDILRSVFAAFALCEQVFSSRQESASELGLYVVLLGKLFGVVRPHGLLAIIAAATLLGEFAFADFGSLFHQCIPSNNNELLWYAPAKLPSRGG